MNGFYQALKDNDYLNKLDITEEKANEMKDNEIAKLLNTNSLWFFNVIITYSGNSQEMFDIIMRKCCSDNKFMSNIFEKINREKLSKLIKISTCMEYTKKSNYPEFLSKRNGKYFFNYLVNTDADTVENYAYLTKYIELHQ